MKPKLVYLTEKGILPLENYIGPFGAYHLPTTMEDLKGQFILEAYEQGGRLEILGDSGSHAIIVCGINGEKITANTTSIPYPIIAGKHAIFYPKDLVTVEFHRSSGQIHVTRYYPKIISTAPLIVAVAQRTLVEAEYDFFTKAVEAAKEKANCHHCTHIHYAL